MCKAHYQHWRENDPSRPRCTTAGCTRAQHARGLCKPHYTAALLAKPRGRCSVDGCDQPVEWRKLCALHLDRIQRTGSTGADIPRWHALPADQWTPADYQLLVDLFERTRPEHRGLVATAGPLLFLSPAVLYKRLAEAAGLHGIDVRFVYGETEHSQRVQPWELKKPLQGRDTCPHGHPYTVENSRYRRRVRTDPKNGIAHEVIERDCITCRKDAKRRTRQAAPSRRTA